MLEVPHNPAQLIFDEVAVRSRPLLTPPEFVRFCHERNLEVDAERLRHFEELRILMPVVRVKNLGEDRRLHLNGEPLSGGQWSDYIIETSARDAAYTVPPTNALESMPFYSAYQLWTLEDALREMNTLLGLEHYLEDKGKAPHWKQTMEWMRNSGTRSVEHLREPSFRQSVPLLSQFISNRYLASARTDQRTIAMERTTHDGEWLYYSSTSWDWWDYRESYDPYSAAAAFSLDEDCLDRAHLSLSITIRGIDPLYNWANLIQFVNRSKREALSGDALRAQTYREMAEMLRLLHRDLYGSDLGMPDDRFGRTITHVPELEVRKDTRKHLEYVVNQYNLNPQPKATLFVEGESEVAFIETVYERVFGNHFGVSGIEIVNLKGVDNATGRRMPDMFNAIFRLVDYLQDHQVAVFLALDNENQARRLKEAARKKKSLFGIRKFAIPAGRIRIWHTNFEFANFSDTEIAVALSRVAGHKVKFVSRDVKAIRQQWRQLKLDDLYKRKTGRGLDKPALARELAEIMVAPSTRRKVESRPIAQLLIRVQRFGSLNHLPVMREVWERNQAALDRSDLRIR